MVRIRRGIFGASRYRSFSHVRKPSGSFFAAMFGAMPARRIIGVLAAVI
jgi:hypothetical protein